MSEPSFLPLMNTIAVAECKGEALLRTWADCTSDESLATVLRFVAIREGEHSWAFTKRMCELGFEVCEDNAYKVFKDFDGLMGCLGSGSVSDAEKVSMFQNGTVGSDNADAAPSDPFASFFNDTSIDPQTGELFGRYICEERDSGRRLKAEFDRVCGSMPMAGSEIGELRDCINALRAEVAQLRNVRNVA